MINERILTVSQLSDYLFGMMGHDPILRNVSLQGEVSNFRRTSAGHCYFALKDDQALLNCVLFSSAVSEMDGDVFEGAQVIVRGYVSLYAKDGRLQLYVNSIQSMGLGELFLKFEKLKVELQSEGLFDSETKKEMPFFPKTIGIVTSPKGSVLHDIWQVCQRRCPSVKLLLAPASVQGENAPTEICHAIEQLNQVDEVDVIILARGGGSIEDLWAFNTREVAECIYNSEKPIISAVGHETDFSIADFVADVRASTPSVAAEMATPTEQMLLSHLFGQFERMKRACEQILERKSANLFLLQQRLITQKPAHQKLMMQHKLDYLRQRLYDEMQANLQTRMQNVLKKMDSLAHHSPQHILQLGYALITKQGKTIERIAQLKSRDTVQILLQDGQKTFVLTEKE